MEIRDSHPPTTSPYQEGLGGGAGGPSSGPLLAGPPMEAWGSCVRGTPQANGVGVLGISPLVGGPEHGGALDTTGPPPLDQPSGAGAVAQGPPAA